MFYPNMQCNTLGRNGTTTSFLSNLSCCYHVAEKGIPCLGSKANPKTTTNDVNNLKV